LPMRIPIAAVGTVVKRVAQRIVTDERVAK
jgi:hypothetical protein